MSSLTKRLSKQISKNNIQTKEEFLESISKLNNNRVYGLTLSDRFTRIWHKGSYIKSHINEIIDCNGQ